MKTRNYIIVFVISIITILFTFYFCEIYRNSVKNVDDSSIGEVLINVTGASYDDLYSNISNYTKENDDYVIYVASYKKSDISLLEKNLKEIVIKDGLKNVLYINADELKKSEYLNRLLDDFGDGDVSNGGLPLFIFFRNQKIYNVVSIVNMDEYSLKAILEGYDD